MKSRDTVMDVVMPALLTVLVGLLVYAVYRMATDPSFREFKLSDGTRCVAVSKHVTCEWLPRNP